MALYCRFGVGVLARLDAGCWARDADTPRWVGRNVGVLHGMIAPSGAWATIPMCKASPSRPSEPHERYAGASNGAILLNK